MASIDALSWNSVRIRDKLALLLASWSACSSSLRSSDPMVRAAGYSSLSSTYYSIAGTAFAQLQVALRPRWLASMRIALWCVTWLPLGLYCYWRMFSLSRMVVRLIGYAGMSPDQCDIRQSILRRRGKHEEAIVCIRAALEKQPEKAHTRGLLYVGLAEASLAVGRPGLALDCLHNATIEAEKAETKEPRQAARIYRHCADLARALAPDDHIESARLQSAAQRLIDATASKDQRLKLEMKSS